jgi:hypothetical protein
LQCYFYIEKGKVLAAPETCACLKEPKIALELGNSKDDFQLKKKH